MLGIEMGITPSGNKSKRRNEDMTAGGLVSLAAGLSKQRDCKRPPPAPVHDASQ